MHILLLISFFLNFLFSKNNSYLNNKYYSFSENYKIDEFVKNINSYEEFKSIIDSNDFCFFYVYNGEIFNEKNAELNKIKNNDFEIIEEISTTNPYYKKKRILFFSIDYSKKNLNKFKKFYKPEFNSEVLFFYKGEISFKEKLEIEGLKNANNLMNLINEAYNFNNKIIKKRKKNKQFKKVKIIRNLDNQNHCCYSSPSFGFNFGFGMPYYNWPGYYYGFGNPYFYRPYIGFNASFPIRSFRK